MQGRLMGYGVIGGELFRAFWRQAALRLPFFRVLLGLLLSIDVALILIHLLFMTGVLEIRLYSIENDQGYAEFYQAIKQGWLVLIFFWYARQSANWRYLVWSAIFFYVLLDDFLMGHEKLGEAIVAALNIQDRFGLRGQDFGELLVIGTAALGFIPLLAKSFFSGDSSFRSDTLLLISGFAVYAAFAIGVDMLHIPFLETPLSGLFGLLEDGGELILISILLWVGFLMLARKGLIPIRT